MKTILLFITTLFITSLVFAGDQKAVGNSAKQLADHLPPEFEHRVPKNRFENPEYNNIGVVRSSGRRGTGFMINDCLMMTNKHVIGANQVVVGKNVTFEVGQSRDPSKSFEYKVSGAVVASGNQNLESITDDISQDWAIVKLDQSIGKQVGKMRPAVFKSRELYEKCESFEIAGYPGEKPINELWWQGNCQMTLNKSGPKSINLNCPITAGNSGSPLMCQLKSGGMAVVGIVKQDSPGNEFTESFATNFDLDREKILAAYKKYKDSCK
jgi:V8-like Glu-specific endopeptidase